MSVYVSVVPETVQRGKVPMVSVGRRRTHKSPLTGRADVPGSAGIVRTLLRLEEARMELSGLALAGFYLGIRWMREQQKPKQIRTMAAGRKRASIKSAKPKKRSRKVKRRKPK